MVCDISVKIVADWRYIFFVVVSVSVPKFNVVLDTVNLFVARIFVKS